MAVPKRKWKKFSNLMKARGVEATIIGEFTDSGRCVVKNGGQVIMNLEMNFLHNGLPPRPMETTYTKTVYKEPKIPQRQNLTKILHEMLARLNITSFEFISQQYDHEVQGGSVLKPLQGRGKNKWRGDGGQARFEFQKRGSYFPRYQPYLWRY